MMAWMEVVRSRVSTGFQNMMKEEKGDTNFISILIILGIVIILAGVFIVFKDQIVTQVEGIMNNFTIK